MKHIIYMVLAGAMMMTGALSSCEYSNNGDLDGMWLMTRVDSLQTGKTEAIRGELKTWSFQGEILQFYNYREDSHQLVVMSRFDHTGNLLVLHDPFIYNRMEGDIALTADSMHLLAPHGMNSLPDTFVVEKQNRTKMQIADEKVRIVFEKY